MSLKNKKYINDQDRPRICIQDLRRFRLPINFRGKSSWYVQFWWLTQSIFFGMSPQFMYGWRRFLLRRFGAKVGEGVIIRPSVRITFPWNVTIGDWAWIGDNVELYSLGEIVIGEKAVISQRSYICTGSHDYTKSTFNIFAEKIIIEPEVWVAADVYVAPGVCIGRGCVVGARSSVFKDLPSMMICYGNPAKPIKPRVVCAS